MLSWKITFLYPIFAPLVAVSSAADIKHWIDPSCHEKIGFDDAMAEIIWASGQLADALKARDQRLNDPLQWLFNFAIDATPQVDYVENTYRRISSLRGRDDKGNVYTQQDALLRHMCDFGKSFVPKSHKGEVKSEPPQMERKLKFGYHDEGNDMWEVGRNLNCKFIVDPEKPTLANTSPFISLRNAELLKDPNRKESQPYDRVVTSVCEPTFSKEKNAAWLLPTFREFAQGDLSAMKSVTQLGSHLALTLIHEMVHVPFLSTQDKINWPLQPEDKFVKTVGYHGRDWHGPLQKKGYFTGNLIGPELGDWQYTVMNPDSYAYLLAIFRFMHKQWEPYLHDQEGRQSITFRKKTDWEVIGDWPGAGETPAFGDRGR